MAVEIQQLGNAGWHEVVRDGRRLGFVRETGFDAWEYVTFDDSASGLASTKLDAVDALIEYTGSLS